MPTLSSKPQRRYRQRQSWSVTCAVYALAGGLSGGCQSFKSLVDCNRALGATNTTLEEIEDQHSEPPSSRSYLAIADLYAELQANLSTNDASGSELSKAAKRFAKHIQRVERQSREYSQALQRLERALEAQDAAQETRARSDLERIRERAEGLVDKTKGESRRFAEVCRPSR